MESRRLNLNTPFLPVSERVGHREERIKQWKHPVEPPYRDRSSCR